VFDAESAQAGADVFQREQHERLMGGIKHQYIPSNEEVREMRDAFAADADGLAEKSPGPEAVWNRRVSLAMADLLVMRELHENAREGMGRVRDAVSDLNSAVRRIRS